MNQFPKDCWSKNCKHFHVRDMSIDDWLCTCDVLKMRCDACDEDFSYLLCPLAEEGEELEESRMIPLDEQHLDPWCGEKCPKFKA